MLENRDVLQVQIDNLKQDVNFLKESQAMMMENINRLNENIIRLTVLAEKQDERMTKQEEYQNRQSLEIQKLREENLKRSSNEGKMIKKDEDSIAISKDVIKIIGFLVIIIAGILGINLY